ncbi:MAG: hypothetical protein A2167_06975 [Planctomycetes bacterium RBG_13_46_10]|nr:MAG: hypothetical protein A2167_06975 [Planctomycetes bacterium RBG_13_46_10]
MSINTFQDLTKAVFGVIIYKLNCNNQLMEENRINRFFSGYGKLACAYNNNTRIGIHAFLCILYPEFLLSLNIYSFLQQV